MNSTSHSIVVVHQTPQKVEADLALLLLFKDDRPPKGFAGIIDWYLNGHISYLIKYSYFKADLGEIGLLISESRTAQQGVLLMGMGNRQKLHASLIERSVEKAVEVLDGLRGRRIILNPFFSDDSCFEHPSIALLHAALHFLRSPTLSNRTKKNTIEFVITIESMEELQNLRNRVFKLRKDKTLTQVNFILP
jgi:hypothetical protein